MSMVITVTSGKGGVGKSTTVTNIGVGLAREGKKVLLIDGDTGVRKLDIFLGLEQHFVYDIISVIKKECSIDEAIVQHPEIDNLSFLPTSQIADKKDITPKDMIEICNSVKKNYDFILIDCPAGIEEGFKSSIAPCDLAVVVVVPEIASVRDADKVMGLLEKEGKNKTIVVNKIDKKMVKRGQMLDIAHIDEMLRSKLLGVVPFDKYVSVFTNKGSFIVDDKKMLAGKAYSDISKRLLGHKISIPLTFKESFFVRLLRVLMVRKEA